LAAGGTNITGLAGQNLIVKVTNLSTEELRVSPGPKSPFDRELILQPSQSGTVHDAPIVSLAQIVGLFGCDTHEHAVSFLVNLEFRPPLRLERQMKILAQGRDAL